MSDTNEGSGSSGSNEGVGVAASSDDTDAPRARRRWDYWMAICAGLSLGLLVHRYAVLPFVTDGFVPNALLWIALGLLAGARAAYKAGLGTVTSGIVTPARLAIAILAALVGAGAGFVIAPPLGFVALRTRALPGFEVSLPSPAPAADPKLGSYQHGRLDLKRPAGMAGAISIEWSPGGLFDDDEVEMTIEALGAMGGPAHDVALDVEVPVSGGLPARSWSARVGENQVWMTQVRCGARRVQITTGAAPPGAKRLHRRVVGSLRCHPDPAAERSVGDIPVMLALGTGWSRVRSDANQLQLTDGADTVIAHAFLGHPSDRIIKSLGKAMPALHVGTGDGNLWSISVDIDHGQHPGWLRLCDCNRDNQTLLLIWIAGKPEPDLTRGREIVQRARCRQPDERPQSWPDLRRDDKVP